MLKRNFTLTELLAIFFSLSGESQGVIDGSVQREKFVYFKIVFKVKIHFYVKFDSIQAFFMSKNNLLTVHLSPNMSTK